jgi:BirA family biotin operon repressor/biotin-[acetyl-CoA-carboxylase] ligase
MNARGAPLAPPKAREEYTASVLRGEALIYERLESTNLTLRAMAVEGAPEGTVVVAEEQVAGRGRNGRSWHSPAGAGFYGSILLRPSVGNREAQFLPFVAAIAVAESLASTGVKGVEIKWPNDVLISRRKVSGILVETGLLADAVEWAVVGIGINVTRDAVPAGSAAVATSLEEAGIRTTPDRLRWPLLVAFDRWYAALLDAGSKPVLGRWEALAPMAQGLRVQVTENGETYPATTRGVTADGFLRVERGDGTRAVLSAADVSVGLEERIEADLPPTELEP